MVFCMEAVAKGKEEVKKIPVHSVSQLSSAPFATIGR